MKLTEEQQRTLRATIDRIIPPDDYAGAWDAGVADYLLRQFEGDLSPVVELYLAGLSSLEDEASTRYQNTFEKLSDDEKDFLLRQVEIGEVRANWTVSPPRFFTLLVETTVEGFYSDPEQGGNRDRLSWVMTEFESA
jgi:hypothetical protein